MRYLHTMVRVSNLQESLTFYCDHLGLAEAARYDNEAGRFTLVFLCAPEDLDDFKEHSSPALELTYNWDESGYDGGRNFGHLAYRVDNTRPARNSWMPASLLTDHRAAATWPLCALPTMYPSSYYNKAAHCSQWNPGDQWKTSANGSQRP